MLDFTTLFVDVDDCWKVFQKIYNKHCSMMELSGVTGIAT